MSSNIIWKNIHLCFSKFRQCPPTPPPAPQLPPPSQDHSRRPLRPNKHHNRSPTIDHASDDSTSKSLATTDDFPSTSDDSESTDPQPLAADFSAAFASHRFFFSSPGRSNSIVEDSKPPPPPGDNAVAVHTLSPDPYSDFRRSMQEMVESCGRRVDVRRDWDYLQELLACYLALNPEHTHKFILGAYADLLVYLVSSSDSGDLVGSRRRSTS